MRNKTKYAAIGYVVSKVVLPVATRSAKRAAKRKAKNTLTSATKLAKANPARVGVAIGAAVGAIGWVLTQQSRNKASRIFLSVRNEARDNGDYENDSYEVI